MFEDDMTASKHKKKYAGGLKDPRDEEKKINIELSERFNQEDPHVQDPVNFEEIPNSFYEKVAQSDARPPPEKHMISGINRFEKIGGKLWVDASFYDDWIRSDDLNHVRKDINKHEITEGKALFDKLKELVNGRKK